MQSILPKCEIREFPYAQFEWDKNNVGTSHRITEIMATAFFDVPLKTADDFDEFCVKHPTYNPDYPHERDADLDPSRGNALATAAKLGNSKLVNHLLATRKVNVNLGNIVGSTPLYFTASCENTKEAFHIAEMLIHAGADVNLETFDESWDEAVGYNRMTKRYVFDSRVCDENDLYKPNQRHRVTSCETPLFVAAEKGINLPLVKLLLLNGGIIYKPLSDKGRAFVDKAVTELFDQIKHLYLARKDDASPFSSIADVIPQIITYRNRLISFK